MKRLAIMSLLGILSVFTFTACETEIKPDSAKDGKYATQMPQSALEYSIYMNKQITVYVNQLTTRMTAANTDGKVYENEILMTEQSLEIMKDVLEEVIVTYPAKTAEDDREAVITAMETAVKHMEGYLSALQNEEDFQKYKEDFQNDFNALTGLANMYYQ